MPARADRRRTGHYKALREFFDDPKGLVEAAIAK
jgi:hypothetical protein